MDETECLEEEQDTTLVMEEGEGDECIDIDKTLEDKASQNNLSVQNVKSIIHHVLKDERVVQMVQKLAETGSAEDEVIFEPKLTRARVRRAVASTNNNYSPNKTGTISATPSPSGSKTKTQPIHMMPHPLLGLQFPEESSDEEYDPSTENTKDTDDIESDIIDLEDDECSHDNQSVDDTDHEEESEGGSGESTPKQGITTSPSNYWKPMDNNSEGNMSLKTPCKDQYKITPPISSTLPSAIASIPDTDLVQETAVLLASLSDTILSPERPPRPLPPRDTPPRPHPPGGSGDTPSGVGDMPTELSENAGEIANRTRSKIPMVDKDINDIAGSFVPPDVSADDSIIINTPSTCMDEDELHWHEWLASLMSPTSAPSHDGEDDDTEYNFYADQLEDEGEEFRTDRGVKIPQKEVDELIEEILNPNFGLFNTDTTDCLAGVEGKIPDEIGAGFMNTQSTLDPTSAYLLESLGLHLPSNPTPKKSSVNQEGGTLEVGVAHGTVNKGLSSFSNSQMVQLWDQIQQHFQLLLQTFVLTRHEPSLVFLSQIASQAIEEIINLCSTRDQGKGGSIWYVPGLEDAKELIRKCDPNDPDAVELIQSSGQPPKIPIQVQDILMNYGVFWQYPNLIPESGFHALDHPNTSKYFLPSEDGLLALGMDHYGSSAWKLIQQNLLPIKAPNQLHLRVKNLCSGRQKTDNVVKHYKRTGAVVLPFPKENNDDQDNSSDVLKLPSWTYVYNRKRAEKERVEGKRKEKELEAVVRLVKTAGESTAQSTLVGTKRSLSDQFNAVDVAATKRSRKATSKDSDTIETKRKKQQQKENNTNSNEYNQLLYLAGLEANDKAARFAYKYLTEVKATVMDSPGVYDSFLRLVKKARERNWRPVKLYIHMCDTLRPWPHLLKLFMAFVGPLDAFEGNIMQEKFEFEQIKSFVTTLERKYANSPLKLEEIVTTMKGLAKEEKLSQEKVFSSLGPLIEAHEDLLTDLKSFVHGMKSSTCTTHREKFQDDFEEIDLTGKQNAADMDDFEEVYVNDNWTPMYEDEPLSKKQLTENSQTNRVSGIESSNNALNPITVNSQSSSPTSTECLPINRIVISTGSTGISSQTLTASCTLLRSDDRGGCSSSGLVPKTWTREDDRCLLQACLQTNGSPDTLEAIANQLNRSLQEVRSRCTELLMMMKSMTST